jgi:hypothetical protein
LSQTQKRTGLSTKSRRGTISLKNSFSLHQYIKIFQVDFITALPSPKATQHTPTGTFQVSRIGVRAWYLTSTTMQRCSPCQCLKRPRPRPTPCPSLPVPPTHGTWPPTSATSVFLLVVQPLKQEPTHNFVLPRRRHCYSRNLEFPMSAVLNDSTWNMWPHRRDSPSGYLSVPGHVSSRTESCISHNPADLAPPRPGR